MKILFYGFRHSHIEGLYMKAKENNRVEICACLEEDETAKKAMSEKLGIIFDEKSYDEWLKSDVDTVAIGGCYGDRGPAIIKALNAGKHVIADKPICTKMAEYKKIKALSEKNNLKVACMFDLRYMASARRAKEYIESGELGNVRNVSFIGQHCLDYANRPRWYYEKGKHGGTLNDLSIHGVDLITHLTGLKMEKVLSARTWNAFATEQPEFKDCGMFMAKLSNGAGVMADVSYSAPLQIYNSDVYWNFKFWCDKGMLTFHYSDNRVWVYKHEDKEPLILDGIVDGKNYLDDLIDDIANDDMLMTQSVLNTTEQVLKIQRATK